MEQTKEEQAYRVIGDFVDKYEKLIKPLFDKGKISEAQFLVDEQFMRSLILLGAKTNLILASFCDAETELAMKVGGEAYGHYRMALRNLKAIYNPNLDKFDELKNREVSELIKIINEHVLNIDSLLKGNRFYEEQRQRKVA